MARTFVRHCVVLLMVAIICLVTVQAECSNADSLAEHTDVLVVIIAGLASIINFWITYSQIKMGKIVAHSHDILIQLVTQHNLKHPDTKIDI